MFVPNAGALPVQNEAEDLAPEPSKPFQDWLLLSDETAQLSQEDFV
jgi:hypothetical protein